MTWLIWVGLVVIVFLLLLIFSLCKISSIGDEHADIIYNTLKKDDENGNNQSNL